MFNLVQTATEDELVLSGLFSEGDTSKLLVIHIHGFEGDFFTRVFVHTIAFALEQQNIAFLSVQTRGMASDYLFQTTSAKWKRCGSHFELHEDAHYDIDAWIKFALERGYNNIILQGHSLGTMKVIRYLFQGKQPNVVTKLILLAPFDNIFMAESFGEKKWRENVKRAKQKVAEGKGEEIMPKEYWDIELSYQTYVTWLDENEYTHMFNFYDKSYSFPILNKIQIPVQVIVGTSDEYLHGSNPEHPEEAMEIMKKHIKDFSYLLIEGANHGYVGYEQKVADEVVKFVTKV